MPIGSNEQHGPTGLLGTDWMCPEIIACEAQTLSDDLLIAPTFNIGMAQHHLAFPGTIFLRPTTFIAAIGDWCRSLGAHACTGISSSGEASPAGMSAQPVSASTCSSRSCVTLPDDDTTTCGGW